MSDQYAGSYLVLNGSPNQITNVVATHRCDGKIDPPKSIGTLNSFQASGAVSFNSKSSHGDHWSVTFSMDGKNLTAKADCAYKQKDAPQLVVIALFEESFSIFKPLSKACRNVAYSSSSAAAGG